MVMRRPMQKPMIGAVSKPKPTTPAPQEPNKAEALPLDKFKGKQQLGQTLNLPDSMRRENRPATKTPSALNMSAEQIRNEAVDRENQIQQSLIDQGVNPDTPISPVYAKPAPAPIKGSNLLNQPKTISPLQQFQQDQQRLYQTQPASQQMQAQQAEPVQPAAQEMQSAAPEAPAQDNSAIDAQIAQLQQQIAQLQSQKK